MKKAFTLIELLVVIAIIAILAAILFPVFAQAKAAAKKTSDLSNLKQIQLSELMYVNDYDDMWSNCYPNDQLSLWTTPAERDAGNWSLRNSFSVNALAPYIKNWALWKSPGAAKDWLPFAGNPGPNYPNPTGCAMSFEQNPYLSMWNSSAIDSPAQALGFWPGAGNAAVPGFSYAEPLVITASNGFLAPGQYPGDAYVFQNSGPNCVSGYGVWSGEPLVMTVFNNGFNIARTDGHAKFSRIGSGDNPIAAVDANGVFTSYWVNSADYANGCGYSWVHSPHFTY